MAQIDSPTTNEAASTLRWLLDGLGHGRGSVLDEAWFDVRDRMRQPSGQHFTFAVDWIADPWIAKGVQTGFLPTAVPAWHPPDEIDAWPTFGVGQTLHAVGVPARKTRDDRVQAHLRSAPSLASGAADSAVTEFVESEARISSHGDEHMIFGDQVRAWLLTAVGPLVRGVMLSSGVDPQLLVDATVHRLGMPLRMSLPVSWVPANEFGDKHLELLFNVSMQPNGSPAPLDPADLRVGQGVAWYQAWGWLSQDVPSELARGAVRLAARLLRNDPVREGLRRVLASDDPALRTIGVAVARRWALTLKAMTWVEDALGVRWQDVRPADVVCFGFNATKPDWPRRLLAISHRSGDVKPRLRHMAVWRSSRFAIDATYVPSWETNTGMIWGLFAPTPAIVRVSTPSYLESVWCRREYELIQHLLDRSDFVSDRLVVDVDLEGLRFLDTWDTHVRGAPRTGLDAIAPEFPPIALTVWSPRPLGIQEAAILRCGGALRAMSAFVQNPVIVNRFVEELLVTGDLPGLPAPTNHPEGWPAYAAIFRALSAMSGESEPGLMLPAQYDEEQIRQDIAITEWVPDLSSGSPALDDILVAVEFFRTRWPVLVSQGWGRFLALNLHGLTMDDWIANAERSLHRGMVALRSPVPLWLLQRADQAVSNWGLPGDPPILTEHVDAQFGWMHEGDVDPAAWRSRYPADSGLLVSHAVREMLGASAT